MEKIYSKVDSEVLLHTVFRKEDMINQDTVRVDITHEKEFLQVASMKDNKEKVYPKHKHLVQPGKDHITQESLIIMKGSLKGSYYDTNDNLLFETILKEGDCTLTFGGAHKFEVMEDGILFYEHKNGPYLGYDPEPTILLPKSTHMKLEISLRGEYDVTNSHRRCEIEIRFVTFQMPTAETIDEVMFDAQERVKEMLGLNNG